MSSALVSPAIASAADGPAIVAVTQQTGAVRITLRHRHARGQLFGATRRLLSVDAGHSQWVVPASHAVWIPPGVPHGLRSYGPFAGCSVYVTELACSDLPVAPFILAASVLLRAAVTRSAGCTDEELDAAQSR